MSVARDLARSARTPGAERIRLPALLGVVLCSVGCVDLAPLRDRDFDEVTMEQVDEAATRDDEVALAGVEALLVERLGDPESVDIDVALEALSTLRRAPRPSTFDTVQRCADEDPDEEVRYLALDALLAIDRAEADPVLRRVAESDPSVLVRRHATELVAP